MVKYPHSKEETVVQQSILQQAEAVVAAQDNPPRPTRHEALLQETDLIDTSDDDVPPPPAYGDIYGEIRDEKENGLSARVTDDGRVNIRINHFNRRLSQVFTPALHQHVQSVQDSHPPPLPYISPSLGGKEGVLLPPRLNVVIQVVGSRGDVQPFVALGKVLKETYGHRVRLATHPNFKEFVQENGLEFFSIGGDPSRLMAFMVRNPGLMPGFRSVLSGDVGQRRRDVAEYIQGCWRSCYQAGDGMGRASDGDDISKPEPVARPFIADCIIANPPSFAHIHCAEKLGIPLHIMFTMPYSPTQAFPHPLANIQSSNADPQLTNYVSYAMIEVLVWQGLVDIINRFRVKCLGLDPVSLIWAPGMLQRLKVPHTYCWSPALISKPKDWGPHISISGFYLLSSASNYTPAPDLQAFLDAGPLPVYIGFGSIVLDDPNAMTELIFEAVRKTGQRVLLSKGWGGMGSDDLRTRVPNGVFMLGNVPHDWLFERVSCVVHHGGAGTTVAGITAGRPTVVVPFFGDQPFWGAMVARAGAGPNPIPHRQLTPDKLADAINFCLRSESLERAKELACKIAAERGSDNGAQSFHQHLEVDRLRCALAPDRPAAWRIKRTQVRLSPFAACTLANANLVDFRDLKLFRAQEYYTDEGPWDPISGFATAVFGVISSMALGVADFPSETWRALSMPFGSGSSRQRRQSQASMPTMAMKSETSSMGSRSTLTAPTSPEQSQTSLDVQESGSLAPVQSPPSISSQSNPTTNVGSSRVRSRYESSSTKDPDHDMLRPTGVLQSSKGFGRIAKAALHAPIDMSIGITEGFHNAPNLWGDDTVRPQQQVSDLKSGVTAVGKEFAFGWYDGVTGLVTQPWKGAQKEGTSGFFKGIGKGIGGFVMKPGAALFGIPGYFMKGVHKEMQKLFSGNVQNYIVASRAAQGYEEWLQSSEAEKQDVIARWKLIQKYVKKKKHNPDEMMQDILETQRTMNMEDRDAQPLQNGGRRTPSLSTAQSASSAGADAATQDSESVIMRANTAPQESLREAGINETIRLSVQETSSHGDAEIDDTDIERATWGNASLLRLRHQRQEAAAADHQADEEENLRQAMATSEVEAQRRHESETLEYEDQLKRLIVQSLSEQQQRQRGSQSSELESNMNLEEDDGRSPSVHHSPPYHDPQHLAGTTQKDFEAAQEQGQRGEKTTQEKTEEEIVMAYVKKQSMLEQQHHHSHQNQNKGKGKGRAVATEEAEDEEYYEDLQKALKFSMQGAGYDYDDWEKYRYGGASTTKHNESNLALEL